MDTFPKETALGLVAIIAGLALDQRLARESTQKMFEAMEAAAHGAKLAAHVR